MSVIELIERCSARLEQAGVCFGQGTTNAFDEAAWLVLWRLGLPLHELDAVAEQPVAAHQLNAVDMFVEQRIATRRPAAYLTGEAWLQGVPFFVDERVIVPRSLIAEVLADGTLDAWLGAEPTQVLDLCTGNASLAVLAALAWPACSVHAADLSAAALEVAAINLERHQLQARITLHQGDGLRALRGLACSSFDLILCNPPYVNQFSMTQLPPEFRAEPALALAGGADGMDFVRTLLQDLPRHLNDGGALVLEIGHERAFFDAAFPQLSPVWLPTSAGDEQVLLLQRQALL